VFVISERQGRAVIAGIAAKKAVKNRMQKHGHRDEEDLMTLEVRPSLQLYPFPLSYCW